MIAKSAMWPTGVRATSVLCETGYAHAANCDDCYQALDAAIDEREDLLARARDMLRNGTPSDFERTAPADDIDDCINDCAWASSLGGGAW